MTVQEELWYIVLGIFDFLDICAVYYGLQLIRCGFFSFGIFGIVFILRQLLPKNSVFLKGALWILFVPVLFIGKLKLFYESEIGTRLFSWQTNICMNHTWICWLYLCCTVIYAVLLLRKRRRLKKLILDMEKSEFEGTYIYVADIPVTPFTAGVLKPKIVIPRVILNKYSKEEIQTVLLHEKNHIRLLHLVVYFLWDILRVLLWINPLFTIGVKYLKEDMEKICDKVTIQKSGKEAYVYGEVLLKTVKLLRNESNNFNMYATFAGERGFRIIKRRVEGIAGYEPYKQIAAVGFFIVSVLCAVTAIFCIKIFSYKAYNNYDVISVYDIETQALITGYSDTFGKAICYDENYIYIDTKALKTAIVSRKISNGDVYIFLGGYYKLPGIGVGGSFGYLETSNGTINLKTISEEATIKIEKKSLEDIFCQIFKLL